MEEVMETMEPGVKLGIVIAGVPVFVELWKQLSSSVTAVAAEPVAVT
jgi:hypothetical protein